MEWIGWSSDRVSEWWMNGVSSWMNVVEWIEWDGVEWSGVDEWIEWIDDELMMMNDGVSGVSGGVEWWISEWVQWLS